jgi:hypothetical protein
MGASSLFLTSASALSVGTATTKPILPDGYKGQRLSIFNMNASDAITLSDEASMTASNLQLISNTTLALAAGRGVSFVFDGADWRQIGPVTDVLS